MDLSGCIVSEFRAVTFLKILIDLSASVILPSEQHKTRPPTSTPLTFAGESWSDAGRLDAGVLTEASLRQVDRDVAHETPFLTRFLKHAALVPLNCSGKVL